MPRRDADRTIQRAASPSAGAHADLVRKYETLTRKYQQAVKRLSVRARRDADLVAMAAWAVRRGDSAWVFLRGKSVAVANRSMHVMNRSRPGEGRWQPAAHPLGGRDQPHGNCSYGSLTELIVEESERLRSRPPGSLPLRFATSQRVVEVSLERMNPRGNDQATLAIIRDVTALAKMEADLAESNATLLRQERVRALGEVALGVAHDVSNFLGALQLRVQILAHDEVCQASQSKNIAALERIVSEAAGLVGRLQSLARPAGQQQAAFDVRETVLRALEIAQSGLRLRARETGVELRIEHELGALPPVLGVAEDVLHMFVNLLINAKDAMPEGGTIRVRAEADDRAVTVRVEDQGHGIPPELTERVFERFFTTKGQRGSGLGLSMAKEVVERAGGSIRAYNLPEGGACFEVCLLRQRPTSNRRLRARSGAAAPRIAEPRRTTT